MWSLELSNSQKENRMEVTRDWAGVGGWGGEGGNVELLLSGYKVSVDSDDGFRKQLIEMVVPHSECRLNCATE